MRRVLAIAQLNLLELFRDRTELVAVIVLPLLLTWVFGAAFGSGGVERPFEVPVADLDGSVYAATIVGAIDSASAIVVKPVTEAEARRVVRDGDAPVSLIIAEGLAEALEAGDAARVEIVRDPSSDRAQVVTEVVEGAVARAEANAAAARVVISQQPAPAEEGSPDHSALFRRIFRQADGYWEPDPPVGTKVTLAQASEGRVTQADTAANVQFSLGFTVFFVFMTALGSAGGILEDRELGTLRRLLAAPLRKAQLLSGKVLGVAAVAAFEASILVVFGALVFGVPWGTDPLAVGLLLLALVFSATGLGVMVSALVRTRGQMSAIGPVLSTGLAMLGGCYWSIEIASPAMQTVALFTPTGWAMIGLKDVVARGAGLEAVLVPVAFLLGFGALTLAIGVTRLRLE